MKEFNHKILSFLAIASLASMGLIFIFQFRYWNSRVPVIKSKIELKTDAKISIVLGSSHSFYGINSNVISGNWYNYASTSQGYYEDFYILKS